MNDEKKPQKKPSKKAGTEPVRDEPNEIKIESGIPIPPLGFSRKRASKVTRASLEDALRNERQLPWPKGWIQDVLSYNIRMRAAEAGLTQVDLAAASGITTKQIRAIENRRVDPKLTTLEALAAALGCTVPDLLVLPPASPNHRYFES